MNKKRLLNEIMGVPRELDPWVESFYKIIVEYINYEIKNGWEYEGEMTYLDPNTNEEVQDTAKKTDEVIIPGNEIMDLLMEKNGFSDLKDFIKSEMFKSLPLWRPEITFVTTGIPDVVYNAQKSNPIEAAIGSEIDLSLSNLGKIKVLSNVKFKFNVIMPLDEITNKFSLELKSSISHELLHAFQKFKQLEKGKPSHYGKETILNTLTQIPLLSDVEIREWQYFLNLIYLHLSFEANARVTELYHRLKEKGVNTKEDFLKELKDSHIWRQMKMLEDFNTEEFIKSVKLPSGEVDFSSTKNPFELLTRALRGNVELEALKARGVNISSEEEALKSLINMWDVMLKAGNEQLKQNVGIDFNMLPVPQKAKEDPYLFFKFFEDRFHKKAEKWKRKLYRVGSLLTQENN